MGSFSLMHWIIVLGIVVLVFGTKKLRNIGKDLGEGIKSFKEGMRETDAPNQTPEALDGKTIEAQVKEKEKTSV